ncbi:glycoside hydrolase family 38 C-terminal domain-containing protein [Acidicapsa dinghuensis]|uniref:Glycoside hydrolase family 38 C-terminal domain-containing protein n=1 Tax=Acidicapsa dinghuensis TaxID=2218256 RepID=A0ABW1EMI7_9BACT|nr:glycoside hydrolase family 38 C-terminal domain-containing protein [Acidicapsa dinghuensis]
MKKSQHPKWNRREFVAGAATLVFSQYAPAQLASNKGENPHGRDVYIVSNFHPASCGWLADFSKERVYCVNSYLSHLDRVRDDAQYEFVLSEINNIIGIMNFHPERIPELKQRVAEKRVELVNGFFLESTINLSGGEALVRIGSEGLRWYEKIFGLRPQYAWCIDTCGVHDQMAQIAKGLELKALVYTRKNPTGKTIFWTVSPDGSRILTLCPGHYSEASSIYESKEVLAEAQLDKLESQFASKESITPEGASILILGGGGDYSLAPPVKSYPTALLAQWQQPGARRKIRFTTLSKYVDTILPGIQSGTIEIPTHEGGTAYDFDAFWMDTPKVKTLYRSSEQSLQTAESLATIASLSGHYSYPSQSLYESWTLMFLNMDRNTLWGSAGGMVFVSEKSWDVQDRFNWVQHSATQVQSSALKSLTAAGKQAALFNPLNWRRNDPITLKLAAGKIIDGTPCELLPDGRVLCSIPMASTSLHPLKLVQGEPQKPKALGSINKVETSLYTLTLDAKTGAIASLTSRKSGRELLGAQANTIIAERPKKKASDPGDILPPIPGQDRIATSSDEPSTIEVHKGPLLITIAVTGKFYGGGVLRRSIRLYEAHPRIDFETELNDIPDYTMVYANFPLANDVDEVMRGVPFGFSHAAWSKPDPNLHGWAKGIVPAVRWSAYATTGAGGAALFDRGLTGRELNGREASIYLFNAEDKYQGYDNPWMTGKGKHVLEYALLPYESSWKEARVPQAAWEYNLAPAVFDGCSDFRSQSYLETSNNVIVESLRRQGNHMILRFVEAFGIPGEANIKLSLPHKNAAITDLVGNVVTNLPSGAEYRFAVHPQQIVTMYFETESAVEEEIPVTAWDKFVPQQKLEALHAYSPDVIGHPPTGV